VHFGISELSLGKELPGYQKPNHYVPPQVSLGTIEGESNGSFCLVDGEFENRCKFTVNIFFNVV
jgi:hypothetical protein